MFPFMTWRRAIAALALSATMQTYAEHIIGGEIYYDHLGNDQYRITLTLYRDCDGPGAPFDAVGNITIFTGTGAFYQMLPVNYPGSTFIPVVLDSPCLNLPPNLCIETTSYISTITLPANATGYHISYQRCCRQPSIVNLVNPVAAGLTCTTQIPPQGQHVNSSPRFNSLPPIALCLNEPLVFNHSASEPDGDEIVYSLTTPYTGGTQTVPYPAQSTPPPYTPLTWGAGYGPANQIDSQQPMAIDPVTGILTVQPTMQGNYVIAVSAKEYRNGVLLSETIRDFLFSVVPCDATVDAGIAPQTVFCSGNLAVNFTNTSIGGQYWQWNFGDPSTTADVSELQNPSWTYPDHGTYTTTLIVNPGTVCADTAQVTYALYPQPQPSFVVPGPSCGPLDTVLTALGDFGPTATYSWNMGSGATPSTASGPQTGVVFSANGPHSVTLTVQENGCTGSFTATVGTSPQPVAFFTGSPASPLPAGADVVFTDQSTSSGAAITSSVWTLNGNVVGSGGNTWAWNDAIPGTHTITLTITTADGCTSSYSMIYVIIPEDIEIPNVFTPNNDGSNDGFVIENVQYYDNTLTVYNRWGQAVFEATNYKNTWRAIDVPDGTYYYVLHLGDGRDFAGHVTVLR